MVYLFVLVVGVALGYVLRIVRPIRFLLSRNPSVLAVEAVAGRIMERLDAIEAKNAAAAAELRAEIAAAKLPPA